MLFILLRCFHCFAIAMPLSPLFSGEPIFASRYAMLDAFIAYADICCFFTFSTSDITS